MAILFEMHRYEDVTGVSGVGIVAEGCEFSDGTCVIRWLGDAPSTVFRDNIQDAVKIHGHDGKTQFVFKE